MQTELVSIKKVKTNEDNPRFIKDDKFHKLVESIKKFPKMLEIRPIVVNNEMVVLGGNMRLKACMEAGLKEVHIIKAEDLTEEQQREFVIKDNVGYGEWDWEELQKDEWSDLIKEVGLENPFIEEVNDIGEEASTEIGEVKFSEYLGEANNYVVLYFDNDIDWLQAQTHFDLKTVKGKRANGKEWSRGIGRVINGAKYLKKLTE